MLERLLVEHLVAVRLGLVGRLARLAHRAADRPACECCVATKWFRDKFSDVTDCYDLTKITLQGSHAPCRLPQNTPQAPSALPLRPTALLGAAPGGISGMSLVGSEYGVGPAVATLHAVRLITVLLILPLVVKTLNLLGLIKS